MTASLNVFAFALIAVSMVLIGRAIILNRRTAANWRKTADLYAASTLYWQSTASYRRGDNVAGDRLRLEADRIMAPLRGGA